MTMLLLLSVRSTFEGTHFRLFSTPYSLIILTCYKNKSLDNKIYNTWWKSQ